MFLVDMLIIFAGFLIFDKAQRFNRWLNDNAFERRWF